MDSKRKSSFKRSEIGLIPLDWTAATLGELGELKNGVNFNRDDFGEGLPIINVTNLFDGRYASVANLAQIKKSAVSNYHKFLVRKGDILFARSSLVASGAGQAAMVNRLPKKETGFSGFIIRFRKKKNAPIINEFLNYLVRSKIYREFIPQILAGTAITNINQSILSRLPIVFPSIPEQEAVVKIVSDLDAKIELNQQMNRVLEVVGEAVFKRWFVDFEFPNQDGKPYKSSGGKIADSELGEIPSGWQVGGLGDICEIVMGQSPPGETYNEIGEGIPFFQGIRDFGFRFPTKRVYCTAPTRFAEEGDVLLSVRAPVGSLNIADERCAIGRGVGALRLKGKQNSFLYYLLLATRSAWDKYDAKGTVFGSATKQDVYDFKIVIPPKELRDKFATFMEALDKKILLNERESCSLTAIRDLLLPKLMSGKIRVPIDNTVELS